MTKAIVLAVPDDQADDIARLVASALSLNGYKHNQPGVIDWPTCEHDSADGVDQAPFGPDKVWRCNQCGVLFTRAAMTP